MRADKVKGLSLNQVAKKYNVSKSTASIVCRDVFYHEGRIYNSESEFRRERSKRQSGYNKQLPRKHYPSDDKDYRKAKYQIKKDSSNSNLYPCKNHCGKMIKRNGSYCIDCYTKILHLKTERRRIEKEKRERDTEERIKKNHKPVEADVCKSPLSPNQRHYMQIDCCNIGVCKYCGKKVDYSKLQEPYIEQIVSVGV